LVFVFPDPPAYPSTGEYDPVLPDPTDPLPDEEPPPDPPEDPPDPFEPPYPPPEDVIVDKTELFP